METQTQYRDFANFNTSLLQVASRTPNLQKARTVSSSQVTVITHGLNDDEGMTVTFNDSQGLMSLFKDGWLLPVVWSL